MKIVILSVFLMTALFINSANAADLYPIKILEPVKFDTEEIKGEISPKDIARIYGLSVYMGGNVDKGVELTNPKDETQKSLAKNCREYQKLKNDGWLGYTTFDLSMESFFRDTCNVLSLIVEASPSANSNFNKIPSTISELKIFPRQMLDSVFFGEPDLCMNKKDFKDCADSQNGKITLKGNEIKFLSETEEIIFTPSLKADLNKDGYEDIVYNYASYAVGGTFRNYGQVCLEKPNKNKMASVIDCKTNKNGKI